MGQNPGKTARKRASTADDFALITCHIFSCFPCDVQTQPRLNRKPACKRSGTQPRSPCKRTRPTANDPNPAQNEPRTDTPHTTPCLTCLSYCFLTWTRYLFPNGLMTRFSEMLCGMWCAFAVFPAISTAHITRDAPSLRFGDGFDSNNTAVLVTIMGTLISPVGEACPRIPRLQMEPFHERELHGLRGITGNGTGIVREDFALAIVACVGVSEMEESVFFIQLFRQWVVIFP